MIRLPCSRSEKMPVWMKLSTDPWSHQVLATLPGQVMVPVVSIHIEKLRSSFLDLWSQDRDTQIIAKSHIRSKTLGLTIILGITFRLLS